MIIKGFRKKSVSKMTDLAISETRLDISRIMIINFTRILDSLLLERYKIFILGNDSPLKMQAEGACD